MRITEHFSLEELTQSQTADRLGLDNTPTGEELEHLIQTASLMERVRELLNNKSILVSSGYRSPKVNKAVGGSKGSAHMSGYAVDFICPGFGTPRQICEALSASQLVYDQLIWEFGRWVHISFDPRQRRQNLTIDRDGVRLGFRKEGED